MRVYVPTTMAGLAAAHAAGRFEGPLEAHAVTGAVREWYVSGDLDELEHAAFTEAAEAVRSLPAADAGDDDARFALDEAEATELLWYDVTEIPDLVGPPATPPGP